MNISHDWILLIDEGHSCPPGILSAQCSIGRKGSPTVWIEPDGSRSKKIAGFIFIPGAVKLSHEGCWSSLGALEIGRCICPLARGSGRSAFNSKWTLPRTATDEGSGFSLTIGAPSTPVPGVPQLGDAYPTKNPSVAGCE